MLRFPPAATADQLPYRLSPIHPRDIPARAFPVAVDEHVQHLIPVGGIPLNRIRAALAVCLPLLVAAGATSLHAQDRSRTWQYQSPMPDAPMVFPGTTIIIRPGEILDRSSLSPGLVAVHGSASGDHAGRTILSDDDRTLLFIPAAPFAPGERVAVALRDGLRSAAGREIPAGRFSFGVGAVVGERTRRAALARMLEAELGTAPAPYASALAPDGSASIPAMLTPADSFPLMVVSSLDSPSPGNIFLSNISIVGDAPNGPYLIRIDNSAVPVFQRRMTSSCGDFKVQPGNRYSYADWNAEAFYLLDSAYTIVDSIRAVNGYGTDIHELQMLPNGHALLLGLDIRTIDMSDSVKGGDTAAEITGLVVQELDTAKNVVFEWRTLDHIPVTDATFLDLTSHAIDYIHCNAVDLDLDGNILLSSRHTDEITKIDRSTGEIIWRLGGKHNQFTFVNDSIGFSRQHAIRRLPNGHIILFDNGNTHAQQLSRAVEYSLDDSMKTATLVWEYRNPLGVYGFAMGNVQRLPNGNTLIGWGASNQRAVITEVRPDSSKALELMLPTNVCTYRAFRFPGPQMLRTTLVSPADSALSVPYKPELVWNPYAGASGYRVQVASDTGFMMLAADTLVTDTISCRLPKLGLDSVYYWRVRPMTEADVETWSDVRTFTVEAVAAVAPDGTIGGGPRLAVETAADGGTLLLRYALPVSGNARIALADMRGEEVAVAFDGKAGSRESVSLFDARRLPPGVYLCRLASASGGATCKVVIYR
jgi:hypothetical protein